MSSVYLRILLAIGLSLMSVLPSFGVDGRSGSRSSSKGRSVTNEDAATKAVLDRNFKVRYGQEVTIKGQDLKVKFDSVLDDSRCPKDVTCVWAGDAKVLITVRRGNGEASKMELHTNGQFAQIGKYQQYVIKLVALDPYPRTSVKGKPSDYVATLLIGRSILRSVLPPTSSNSTSPR